MMHDGTTPRPTQPGLVDWASIGAPPARAPDPIEVKGEVSLFEAEYRLPALLGTERQVAWARLIRHAMLRNIFAHLMDVTAGMAEGDRKVTYETVEELRRSRRALLWINGRSFKAGGEFEFVERLGESRPTREAKASAAARAALGR